MKKKKIDVNESLENIVGVEDRNWYDGIAYYEDIDTWQRYSRNGVPIEKDEMCRYWYIYKVKYVKDWEWRFEYHWEILSERPDLLSNKEENV